MDKIISALGIMTLTLHKAWAQPTIECGDLPGCGTTSLQESGDLVGRIVSVGVNWTIFLIGIVSMAMMIKSGIDFISAMGDEGKVKKALNAFYTSVAGLLLALLAFLIVSLVSNFSLFS